MARKSPQLVESTVVEMKYQPRPLQAVLHGQLQRFNVIVCHRRWGKTVFSVNEMLDQALRCPRENPQYAYVAPTYGQAERIAWDMLKQHTANIPGVTYNESKLTCVIERPWKKDRIKIFLLGAENPDSIRGIYLDGVILDEFADMSPVIWHKVIRATLSDRKGWAIFIGTPKGQNHFYNIFKTALKNLGKGWYACIHKASQSGVIPPEELEALKAETDEASYEQEFECSFTAALTGAYWGKPIAHLEATGKVTRVPHDPGLLVDTAWDLGVSDTTTIWFIQQYRNEVRVIDYYEMSGEGLEHYAKIIKEGHRAAYNYREHNWPHDGSARDLTTGKERSAVWRELTGRLPVVHKRHDVGDSIDAARRLFPRCIFDADRTTDGLDSLKSYQKKWDDKNQLWQDKPLHNWASHGADSWRLLAMALRPGKDVEDKRNLPRQAETDYDIFSIH